MGTAEHRSLGSDTTSGAADVFPATERTTLKRLATRGCYDRGTIHAILDEALICNVSFMIGDRPFAIPMAFARLGDEIVLHGSTANRMMRALRDGAEACITVTLVDGLVLARSAFHHSINFRCVVIYAHAREITDPDEKLAALRSTIEHVVPDRWDAVRPPSREELLRTMMLALPITEASAKLRSGPPIDEPQDYALGMWAGEVPLRQVPQTPVADPKVPAGIAPPRHAVEYRRPGTREAQPPPRGTSPAG